MNILPVAKSLLQALGSAGVATVVSNAIKSSTPFNSSNLTKALTWIGDLVLTAAATKLSADYIGKEFDAAVAKRLEAKTEPKTEKVEETKQA